MFDGFGNVPMRARVLGRHRRPAPLKRLATVRGSRHVLGDAELLRAARGDGGGERTILKLFLSILLNVGHLVNPLVQGMNVAARIPVELQLVNFDVGVVLGPRVPRQNLQQGHNRWRAGTHIAYFLRSALSQMLQPAKIASREAC